MILLIDNYDSFTYNLYQYIEELGARCRVVRNDALTVKDIVRLKPKRIVLSPGPGSPEESRLTLDVLREVRGIPVLGVCLGHQALGHVFGGKVTRAPKLFHGKTSRVKHDGKGVFRGLTKDFEAARYHSLCVLKTKLPRELVVSATSDDGVIMGLRHRTLPFEGVQFHPESVMTPEGKKLLKNFLEHPWRGTSR